MFLVCYRIMHLAFKTGKIACMVHMLCYRHGPQAQAGGSPNQPTPWSSRSRRWRVLEAFRFDVLIRIHLAGQLPEYDSSPLATSANKSWAGGERGR